jgi:hypothetical protein
MFPNPNIFNQIYIGAMFWFENDISWVNNKNTLAQQQKDENVGKC